MEIQNYFLYQLFNFLNKCTTWYKIQKVQNGIFPVHPIFSCGDKLLLLISWYLSEIFYISKYSLGMSVYVCVFYTPLCTFLLFLNSVKLEIIPY